jgi:copper resistance protein C
MRIARLFAAATAAAILAVLTGSPAWAHNSLTDASPARNATVKKAPEQVKLTFLQKLDPNLTIAVSDADKQKVAAGEPEANGKVGTLTFDEPLINGTYTVAYRVVSTDGHPVQGSYRFTVADPSAAPASAAPAAPSTAPTSPAVAAPAVETVPTSNSGGGGDWWLVVVGTGVAIALVAGGWIVARRRRSSTVTR